MSLREARGSKRLAFFARNTRRTAFGFKSVLAKALCSGKNRVTRTCRKNLCQNPFLNHTSAAVTFSKTSWGLARLRFCPVAFRRSLMDPVAVKTVFVAKTKNPARATGSCKIRALTRAQSIAVRGLKDIARARASAPAKRSAFTSAQIPRLNSRWIFIGWDFTEGQEADT